MTRHRQWRWPQAHRYLTSMPVLVRAFGGNGVAHGGALASDDFAGAALWLPPNVRPDEAALGDILHRTVGDDVQDDVFTLFEEMAKCHPGGPHWYLPLIGVDPAHQGLDFGAA